MNPLTTEIIGSGSYPLEIFVEDEVQIGVVSLVPGGQQVREVWSGVHCRV